MVIFALLISLRISSFSSVELTDKARTSFATTANPRPASPALAASIAAFKANKLV